MIHFSVFIFRIVKSRFYKFCMSLLIGVWSYVYAFITSGLTHQVMRRKWTRRRKNTRATRRKGKRRKGRKKRNTRKKRKRKTRARPPPTALPNLQTQIEVHLFESVTGPHNHSQAKKLLWSYKTPSARAICT